MTTESLEAAHMKTAAFLLSQLQVAADRIAADYDQDNATTLALLAQRVFEGFSSPAGLHDGRSANWRCRFRYYDQRQPDEPKGDSDEGMPADFPGEMIVTGLPNVARMVLDLARQVHGTSALVGLTMPDLDRRLKGLRPTLSRRGGDAVWRIPYDTFETFNERSVKRGWLVRVDISRTTETNNEQT